MVRNCPGSKMETTFYEDQSFQQRLGNSDVNQLKRSMTLDLRGGAPAASKRPKFNPAVTAAPVLSSPDLNLLKLASPELEKLIISSNNGMVTTTPAPATQILFPRLVTEEQELYARGFVEALNELHGGGGSCDSSSQMSGVQQPVSGVDTVVPVTAGATYTTLEPQQNTGPTTFPPISSAGTTYGLVLSPPPPPPTTSHHLSDIIVKDEPQTVPSLGSTPPLSPINMECQEKIKLERKRQRNRIAASKCRRRKLERISRLEDKVKLLKGENSELGSVVHKLKEQVCQLKEQVMDHVHSGCQIMLANHF